MSKQISEKIKAGARVVDVRPPVEFADGAYPNAKNIPLAALQARLGELEPKDEPVVLYCASGARSARLLRLPHSPAASLANRAIESASS
jgi:phage shock protein E